MSSYTMNLRMILLFLLPFSLNAQVLEKREGAPVQGTYDLESYGRFIFLTGYNYNDYSKGGLYRSDDEGETWALKQQDDTPWDIKTYPSYDKIFFLTQLDGMYVSEDSGDTWMPVNTPGNNIKDFEIARNGDWYLVENNKVYKSMDEGMNWTQPNSNFPPPTNNIQNVEIYQGNTPSDDKFICLTINGVFVSDDGQNWSEPTGLPATGTKSYDDLYVLYAQYYLLGAALTGCGDAMIVITQDGEVYASPDGENFTLINQIPGVDNLNSKYLTKTGALPGGRVFATVEDYVNNTNSKLLQWNFCENDWQENQGANWFGQGATGGVNGIQGVIRTTFQFKTADTSLGLILTGEKIEGTDTFRIFKTNIDVNTVGILENAKELGNLSVYPTLLQAEKMLTIHNETQPFAAVVNLVDLAGKVIDNWEMVLSNGPNSLQIQANNLPGLYILQVKNSATGHTSSHRILVSN
ncbi:MAG: hypothetical protein SFW35_04755 [Chitinophagales bacterium]|nr:hypothetical protein [Chitinophagales bacterium]